jgi:hypothetical protein
VSNQEFDIPSPGKFVLVFLVILGVMMPMIVLTSLVLAAHNARVVLLAVPAAMVFPLISGAIGWSIYRRKIVLKDKALATGPFGWKKIAISELALDGAAVIDLQQHPELHPTFRLAGTSMPGYRSGWFWLRDKRTAYLLLTDWRRVLMLPKRDGGVILLSPQRPDALLEALRRADA